MDIRLATANDTEALKKIWIEIFSDSKQFVDWNFENNYAPENVMLCEADGKIASCLHLIPYIIMFNGSPLKAVYISAVATLEEFRGKSYASSVIRSSLEHIKENGADIAFLVPAISGFYEKLGFVTVLEKTESCIKPESYGTSDILFSNPSPETALEIYLDVCSDKKLYLKRSLKGITLISDDLLKNTGGDLKILSDKSGYIMYKECETCIELYEVIAKTPQSEQMLFNYLFSFGKDIKQTLPPVMINALNTDLKKEIGIYQKDISRKNAYFNLIL